MLRWLFSPNARMNRRRRRLRTVANKKKALPKFLKQRRGVPELPATPRILQGTEWMQEIAYHVDYTGDDTDWWLKHVRSVR